MTRAQVIALIAAVLSGGKDWPVAESTIIMAEQLLAKVEVMFP